MKNDDCIQLINQEREHYLNLNSIISLKCVLKFGSVDIFVSVQLKNII
jgi:hypothetical protein